MSIVEPIVVEQTFRAPLERVWRAITDQDEMCQWFFETIHEFRPEQGFETQFTVNNGHRDYVHLWRVTEVIRKTMIVYDWSYAGVPGQSSVAWALSETADGTKLTLTHRGGETFPQNDPAFARETGQAGWEYFLRDRLRAFLERPSPP